jgi:D-alanyl-D-alanine carboxypeptidase
VSTRSNKQNTAFGSKIVGLQKQLGIPQDYAAQHKLGLCEECKHTVPIGKDIFDRDQFMAPPAALAWHDMKTSASSCGIELQVVSAFRSVDYQAGIIRKKLDAGQCMEGILKVSAAPGYSEHHTGRAVDISTPGCEPLEESFEQTAAFEWLKKTAGDYGFRMSFPRDNPHGVAYEPWHWCWIPDTPV